PALRVLEAFVEQEGAEFAQPVALVGGEQLPLARLQLPPLGRRQPLALEGALDEHELAAGPVEGVRRLLEHVGVGGLGGRVVGRLGEGGLQPAAQRAGLRSHRYSSRITGARASYRGPAGGTRKAVGRAPADQRAFSFASTLPKAPWSNSITRPSASIRA